MESLATRPSLKTQALLVYLRVGLLGWATLALLLVALWLQHTSLLPAAYTWFEPLRTVKLVFALHGFPTALAATYGFAVLARVPAAERWALVKSTALREVLRRSPKKAALSVLLALTLPLLDVLLFAKHGMVDHLCLGFIGWHLASFNLSKTRIARLLGYLAFTTALFLAVCYAYTVIKALLFVGRENVDDVLIGAEVAVLGFSPHRVLAAWTVHHPKFLLFCDWVYFRFFDHMILTSVLLTGLRFHRDRNEFLGAVAFCYLIGAPFYYLLPALGPSFYEPQHFMHLGALPLDFGPVRRWLFVNTMNVVNRREDVLETWGYIACMPSLHMAHELVMLYAVRRSRVAFGLCLVFTLATFVAIVALGFHYPIDSLGGFVVAAIAILLARRFRRSLLPAYLSSGLFEEPTQPIETTI